MSNLNIYGANGQAQRIQVQPKDSLPTPEIENNIEENIGLITDWVDLSPKTPDTVSTAWLFGGGPSLEDVFITTRMLTPAMFEATAPRDSIWICKHASPFFTKGWDNVPINLVALDPRPIEGNSTHGIKRLDMYKAAPEHTTFFIASMTSPTVVNWLLDNGRKVVGWHASSSALHKFSREDRKQVDKGFHETVQTGPLSVGGGTNSLLRTVGLCKEGFGITNFRFVGMDSSLRLTPVQEGEALDPNSPFVTELDSVTGSRLRMKISYGKGNKAMYTMGEMACQLQDLEQLFEHQKNLGVSVKVVGTDKGRSLIGQVFDKFQDLQK
jgi:hypothetical protein